MTGYLGETMEQAARGHDVGLRGGAQTANEVGGCGTRLRSLRDGINGGKRGCGIGHDGPLSKECVLFGPLAYHTRGRPARHAARKRREATETAHESAGRRANGGAGQPLAERPANRGKAARQSAGNKEDQRASRCPPRTQRYRLSSSFSMASICCSASSNSPRSASALTT